MSRVLVIAIALLGAALPAPQSSPLVFDVRAHGAKGDGRSADTVAINAAIDAAAAAGGGVVAFPAGRYLTFSIRLKSHITLQFAPGAVLIAGDPSIDGGRYDAPEPNPSDLYQDFGHSHWQNSLIWGVDVEDIAIVGPGLIDGRGLTRRGPGARWARPGGDRPLSMGAAVGGAADPEAVQRSMDGQGNKAIALKRARNVTLRDFAILNGGHFALLATGVDTLTIDNVRVDTNRDGFDIDASRNVRISNVAINSPNDDALVLKSCTPWARPVLRKTSRLRTFRSAASTSARCWTAHANTHRNGRPIATASPDASSSGRNRTAAFATSPSATACSNGRGASRWKPSTGACSRT